MVSVEFAANSVKSLSLTRNTRSNIHPTGTETMHCARDDLSLQIQKVGWGRLCNLCCAVSNLINEKAGTPRMYQHTISSNQAITIRAITTHNQTWYH